MTGKKIPCTNIYIWEDENEEFRFFIPISQRLYFEQKHFIHISLMLFLNYEETEKYLKNYIKKKFNLSFSDESINLF